MFITRYSCAEEEEFILNVLMIVLILIICLLVSSVISHYLPSIPTALTQIFFGIIVALLVNNFSIKLETEWFMLLFIAPLLYNEGVHFPNEELWKMKAPIFGNAIILVVLTAICGGYIIYWLVPEIPLAAALALSAILSPTDPVAVNGITTRVHIPQRIITLVNGESLINDASGLILFNYAVMAVTTGYFLISEAAVDFAYMFAVGTASGVLLGLLVLWLRHELHKQGIADVTFYSLLSLITPFIIYLIAEELLQASGVVAVVFAGVIHSLMEEHFEATAVAEKLLTTNLWSVVTFILNGVVFLLLGLSIPSSMIQVINDPDIKKWHAVGYVFLIGFVILGIRFIWSYVSSGYLFFHNRIACPDKPSLKTSLITALTGVRGTITMAGVLSIPYVVADGSSFPARPLIIFLAAGVILLSLIMATIFLPFLGDNKEEIICAAYDKELVRAKKKILLVAINGFKQEMHRDNKTVAYELIREYRMMFRRLNVEHDYTNTNDYLKRITEVRLIGLRAERKCIEDMYGKNQISQEYFEVFDKSLNYKEEALINTNRADIKYIIGRILRRLQYLRRNFDNEEKTEKMGIGKYIQLKAYRAAIKSLQDLAKDSAHPSIFQTVIFDYERNIEQLKSTDSEFNEKREELREKLRIKIIDMERIEINRMYEAGEINYDQTKELRKFVNHTETIALYDSSH